MIYIVDRPEEPPLPPPFFLKKAAAEKRRPYEWYHSKLGTLKTN